MSEVISVLAGGLGNQMFQYAVAKSLSSRLGVPFALDLRRLNKDGARAFELHKFALGDEVRLAQGNEVLKPGPRPRGILGALLGLCSRRKRRDYYVETGFPFDPKVLGLSAPVTLEGYFQSERYFGDIASTIRACFTPRPELLTEIDELSDRLLPRGPSISLHVRRGDYTQAATMAFHGLLDADYYDRALRLLEEKAGAGLPICVFTDEPEWVRHNLRLPPETRFISEHTSCALQDLIMMSRCSHHITANSSFSWWGAWLNPSPIKIVVTPQEWFRPASGLDTRDLRPPAWLQA